MIFFYSRIFTMLKQNSTKHPPTQAMHVEEPKIVA